MSPGERAVVLRTLPEWEQAFRDESGPAFAALAKIYGSDRALLREKAAFGIEALRTYAERFSPDSRVFLVRSAGRIDRPSRSDDHGGAQLRGRAARRARSRSRRG